MTFSKITSSKSEKALIHKDFSIGRMLAWEATIIADILTLRCVGIIAEEKGKFNLFLSHCFLASVTFQTKFPSYRVKGYFEREYLYDKIKSRRG